MPETNSENNNYPAPHILIVDDDPDQLRLLISALRNTSYRVSVALNGDQGYARASILIPDLILLDVRMPGRNGIMIARLLKKNPLTQHIPIIFLSAMAEKDERLEGLRAGGVDYIGKPFHLEEVLERIRIHLEISQSKNTSKTSSIDVNDPLVNDSNSQSSSSVNLALKQVAIEYIFNHIQEPSLKSTDIALHLKISLHRLNAVFEAFNHISAFEFIRQERMHRAALLLGQSTLNIAKVAMEVGYPNPANFSTEFKKYWKKSPTQLRTEYQANPDTMQKFISSKLK
ncbi:response regulator transcription factor [Comamonas odontotermitis]|uniref:response regulator transcription factor n=1 Tax=Comamonas odontotermitis TaxID=379895 RepID=UPI001CC5ED19|nr:response regulator [Comamonas odontotermitis]UBB15765.1 response regulator [Comamonas odontotermitis]